MSDAATTYVPRSEDEPAAKRAPELVAVEGPSVAWGREARDSVSLVERFESWEKLGGARADKGGAGEPERQPAAVVAAAEGAHALLKAVARALEMPRSALQLARVLIKWPATADASASRALSRLRTLEREVEEAYAAIERLEGATPPREEEMARAIAALDEALEREAAAARQVLEARMSSLERTADTDRRAAELIARYESDAP